MRPRVTAALAAVREGVRSVHIIDGGVDSALLLEVLTNEGVGTAVRSDAGPHFLADSRSYFAACRLTAALRPAPMASSIEVSEEAGVRYLHFGSRWVQGAMRVQRPWALELEYTREMLLPLVLRPESEWPRSVLLIGLGAGSLAKFLYRHRPQAALTAVELSPQVVAAAAQYFRLPDDPARLAIEVGDGAAFVATTTRRYDLILLDGFDGRGRAGSLDTPEFYRAARQRLSATGFLVANLLDRGRGVGASVARIVDAFDQRALILPPSDSGNTVAIAAGGRSVTVELLQLTDRARELKRATGLSLAPTGRPLRRRVRRTRGGARASSGGPSGFGLVADRERARQVDETGDEAQPDEGAEPAEGVADFLHALGLADRSASARAATRAGCRRRARAAIRRGRDRGSCRRRTARPLR